MPAKIQFKSNIRQFAKKLPDQLKKQLPFATSVALNETARLVAKTQRVKAKQFFDRPTPFLLNGFTTLKGRGGNFNGIRSTKKNLSTLLIPGYLSFRGFTDAGLRINKVVKTQSEGGTRLPFNRALVLPVARGQKNRYGNIPNKRVEQLLQKPNVFQAGRAQGLPPGIYERRRRGGLKMLIAYEPRAQYRPLFPYYRIAEGVAKSQFNREFEKAFKKAVMTMRIK
jgi:hypothetical protein